MDTSSESQDTTPLSVIWRRKWIIVACAAAFAVTTGLISISLPKIYSTSSTLLVAQISQQQSFDSVQASQAVARSYADVLQSPNIARLVRNRLGGSTRPVSVDAVPETQLIKITAEDPSAKRAKAIADTYATVFIGYARQNLQPTTQAKVLFADAAATPGGPARPKPTLYVLLATILGLAVGLTLAFLRERLDKRLRSIEDLEGAFGFPVLARVPRRGRSTKSAEAYTEAFRFLRTNLRFAGGGEHVRTLAVVSADEGEGKTTTTGQLALVTAYTGDTVVAVEADLRRPALQKFMLPDETEPLEPGLSNYLLGRPTLAQILHPTNLATVRLVPSGPPVPSLSSLLETPHGQNAIREIGTTGDLVIFDCPPLGAGADAATVAGRVDGVILVVDLARTNSESVRAALRKLDAVHARVLGFVVNRDRHVDQSYGYFDEAENGSRRSKTLART